MHVCAKKDKRTSKIQGLDILCAWPERVKSRSNWHNRIYRPIMSCIILTTCRSSRPTCMLIIVTHINTVYALYKRKHTMNIMRKNNYVMCFVIQNMHCFFPTSRETGGPRDGYGIGAPCGTTVRDIPYHGHHDRYFYYIYYIQSYYFVTVRWFCVISELTVSQINLQVVFFF